MTGSCHFFSTWSQYQTLHSLHATSYPPNHLTPHTSQKTNHSITNPPPPSPPPNAPGSAEGKEVGKNRRENPVRPHQDWRRQHRRPLPQQHRASTPGVLQPSYLRKFSTQFSRLRRQTRPRGVLPRREAKSGRRR